MAGDLDDTQKPFPLLRLPPELRRRIYGLVFQGRTIKWKPTSIKSQRQYREASGSVTSFLLVSRSMHQECRSLLLQETTVDMNLVLSHNNRLTDKIFASVVLPNIKHVAIRYLTVNNFAPILEQLPKLASLNVDMFGDEPYVTCMLDLEVDDSHDLDIGARVDLMTTRHTASEFCVQFLPPDMLPAWNKLLAHWLRHRSSYQLKIEKMCVEMSGRKWSGMVDYGKETFTMSATDAGPTDGEFFAHLRGLKWHMKRLVARSE